jgi:hypothetical protein
MPLDFSVPKQEAADLLANRGLITDKLKKLIKNRAFDQGKQKLQFEKLLRLIYCNQHRLEYPRPIFPNGTPPSLNYFYDHPQLTIDISCWNRTNEIHIISNKQYLEKLKLKDLRLAMNSLASSNGLTNWDGSNNYPTTNRRFWTDVLEDSIKGYLGDFLKLVPQPPTTNERGLCEFHLAVKSIDLDGENWVEENLEMFDDVWLKSKRWLEQQVKTALEIKELNLSDIERMNSYLLNLTYFDRYLDMHHNPILQGGLESWIEGIRGVGVLLVDIKLSNADEAYKKQTGVSMQKWLVSRLVNNKYLRGYDFRDRVTQYVPRRGEVTFIDALSGSVAIEKVLKAMEDSYRPLLFVIYGMEKLPAKRLGSFMNSFIQSLSTGIANSPNTGDKKCIVLLVGSSDWTLRQENEFPLISSEDIDNSGINNWLSTKPENHPEVTGEFLEGMSRIRISQFGRSTHLTTHEQNLSAKPWRDWIETGFSDHVILSLCRNFLGQETLVELADLWDKRLKN